MLGQLHANNTDEILGKCREDSKKKPGETGEYLKGWVWMYVLPPIVPPLSL